MFSSSVLYGLPEGINYQLQNRCVLLLQAVGTHKVLRIINKAEAILQKVFVFFTAKVLWKKIILHLFVLKNKSVSRHFMPHYTKKVDNDMGITKVQRYILLHSVIVIIDMGTQTIVSIRWVPRVTPKNYKVIALASIGRFWDTNWINRLASSNEKISG